MIKLTLENPYETNQKVVEVSTISEAVEKYCIVRDSFDMGASDFKFADTGKLEFEDGTTNYISYNGRVWDREYWKDLNAIEVPY